MMKTYILSTACYLIAILSFSGCKKDKEFKDVGVTEVTTFYAPDNGKQLILAANGTLYFEWEKSTALDNGVVYYDVLFDKADGDFSNPLYSVPADNNGIGRGATITHKVLNRVGGYAGINSAEVGTLKWTVVASRGLSKVISKQSRLLKITRLSGIDAPTDLYLTGEGTEGGAGLATALKLKSIGTGGEFEVYTKLAAGKYKFVDSRTNVTRTFSVDATGVNFKENADGATVAKAGIYKINLDFSAGTITFSEITKVEFFMCSANQRVVLPYLAKGKWKGTGINPSYGGDDRYFFWITMGGSQMKLGSKNKDNQPPANIQPSAFHYLFLSADGNQWDYSFKFPNRVDLNYSMTVDLSAEAANYTHLLER